MPHDRMVCDYGGREFYNAETQSFLKIPASLRQKLLEMSLPDAFESPRRESNPDLELRRFLHYPLCYEGDSKAIGEGIIARLKPHG